MKFKRWPLDVNPEMDAHAREEGFPHWSCVSPMSNDWWIRKDGFRCIIDFYVRTYMSRLV